MNDSRSRACYRTIVQGAILVIGGFCAPLLLAAAAAAYRSIGSPAEIDRAQAVAVDSHGAVYVTGYSYSQDSGYDFATLKYSPGGEPIWASRYDGPAHLSDYATGIAVDSRDQVFVTGHSSGRGTSLDIAVIKYDSSGHRLWAARYDGPSRRDDYAQALALDAQGHPHVTGYSFGRGTEHDFVTLKYDPEGRLIWKARYNPPRNRDDSAAALRLDSSGCVYVTGTDRVHGTSYDFATLKYDSRGKRMWLARYSGEADEFDTAQDLAVDAAGHVYVTGYSYSRQNGYDMVTVKYDDKGQQVWTARFNGPAGRMDTAHALTLDPAGNAYIAGKSFGGGSQYDLAVIKYDPDGKTIWQEYYEGPGRGADVPVGIALDPDGCILITGYSRGEGTDRDVVLLKYAPDGKRLWTARYDGPSHGEDTPTAMALDREGNVVVTGYSFARTSDFDFLTLKYNSAGELIWEKRYRGEEP